MTSRMPTLLQLLNDPSQGYNLDVSRFSFPLSHLSSLCRVQIHRLTNLVPPRPIFRKLTTMKINKSLLPIQVSAANIPTTVRVYSIIQSLIQPGQIDYPDLLVITQLKLNVGMQLWQKFEHLESPALRKSF